MRKFVRISLLVLVLAVALSLYAVPVNAASATVSTDKPDYAPGETVLITGQNFKAFGNITIKITKPDLTTGLPGTEFETATTMADQFGAFKYYYYLLDGRFGQYQVEASDGTNSATCTFYDTPTPYMFAEQEYTEGTSNTVSWQTPPNGAKSYEVQAATDSGFVATIGTGLTVHPTAQYSFGGLTLGTKYYYRARAFNKSDPLDPSAHPSDWSNVVFSTQGTAPSPDLYAPVASAGGPYSGSENSPVTLNASASYDPDVGGYIATYEWDWNSDGLYDQITSTPSAAHTWNDNGAYIVGVRVTDGASKTGTTTTTVNVANVAPAANAGPDQTATAGSSVSFSGSATDPGVLDTLTYSWDFDGSNGIQQDALGQSVSKVYSTAGTYTVTLTVTDKDGGVGTDTAVVTVTAAVDSTAPSAVTNLAVSTTTSNSATLTWTASGDDGNVGTASQYDIRYSTSAITDANWAAATQVTGEPLPKAAGSAETFTVTGLGPSTTYYFALKTADEVPNWSGISNSPSGTTLVPADTTPPAVPTGLAATPGNSVINLTWNANSEPDLSGYKIYYGTAPGTYGPAINAGNVTGYQLTGLTNGTAYYVAVSAYDTASPTNESAKSAEITSTPTTAPIIRYDDASPAIVFNGTWNTWENALPSGGTLKYSNTTGNTASFTFNGTAVKWIESKQANRGIAKVYIDGVPITDGDTALLGDTGTNKSGVDLYSATALWGVAVYSKSGLAPGTHTIKVEVTGLKNAASSGTYVCVDAFESDAALARYEDISSSMYFSGSWATWVNSLPSGGSLKFSNTPGDTATAVFYGTSVTWIESKQANRGIAKVYIDGVPITDGDTALPGDSGTNKSGVDLYSATALWQQVVYQKSGLAPGYHTIKVEVTGLKNAASSGTYVCVDAFESQGAFARFEDTSTYITWTGTWARWDNPDHPTGGGIKYSNAVGSTATFTFTGSNVSWIEAKQGNRGIAKVYIDGVPITDGDTALSGDTGTNKSGVNLYSASGLWRQGVYAKSGLSPGTHTIKIEVTGLTTGSGTYVGVDAFDVW